MDTYFHVWLGYMYVYDLYIHIYDICNIYTYMHVCLWLGLKMIERHRLVNKLLAEELKNSIHALSIQAKTGINRYVCIKVYIYICVCKYVCINIYIYIYIYMYWYMNKCIYMCMRSLRTTYTHYPFKPEQVIYVCVCKIVCIDIYVCIDIWTYMYVYAYICIFMYAFSYIFPLP
jgi:hypothetical protein